MNRVSGFSLVELMIALLLSAFVLMAVVGMFQQSKSNQLQNEQIARMQESGRYAVRLLARDLGMAGYFGGVLDTGLIDNDLGNVSIGTDCKYTSDGTGMLRTETTLIVLNDAADTPYDCIAKADILAGTDLLGIKRVADAADRIGDDIGGMDGDLTPGTIYLKANGENGLLFGPVISAGDNGPSGVANAFSEIRRYAPAILYVSPNFTLMREALVGNQMETQELVEGIENVQVEWGIDGGDTDLAPDFYLPDPDAAELSNAVTARIYVLVRSADPVPGYSNDKTYNLGSKAVGPFNDPVYRRVYSTTVALRNSSKLKTRAI